MKKVLAVLLTLVMAFSLAAPALAADVSFGDVQTAVGDVKNDASAVVDSAKDVYDNIQAEDTLETVNSVIDFARKLATAIHTLVHSLSEMFDFGCPFCAGPVILPATPENLAEVLATAQEGEIVSLTEGDYGVITLGALTGITVSAEEGAAVDYIATTAETSLTNVTLKGFALEIEDKGEYGILIDSEAVIDNLIIEDTTFTGPATVKNCYGIKGNNVNAIMTVRNCTFKDTGYAIYSAGKGGYAALTFDGCSFDNIYSWVIHVQYGFTGDLTINGCTFTACEDGVSKNGSFSVDKTFTFTNNVLSADCAGHDGKDSKWFELKTANAVVSGNTYADAEWVPAAEQGIKAL